MEVLLASSFGLVAHHYYRMRKSSSRREQERIHLEQEDSVVTEVLGAAPVQLSYKSTALDISDGTPAPNPLGVRTLKTDNTTERGYDEKRFEEQYLHPQDTNPNLPEKPWMRMVNAPYKPKEEVLSSDPVPQDLFGKSMRDKVNKIESDFAMSTVPVTSEKQFDRPVDRIATGNGSNRGFHIGGGQRHHKFLFNEQETIESSGGPKGAFSGGGKSHQAGEYRTITQRAEVNEGSYGPPVAVGVPQSGNVLPSFEITPAQSESWKLDVHSSMNSRAPVAGSAYVPKTAFDSAHDENFQILENSLATGGERFATGASGNRETRIHVPLNKDFDGGSDTRTVPNFKISKASDFKDQEVTFRTMMIPEMSQNVSALRKNPRAAVTGDTVYKNSEIDTQNTAVGASSRGLSLHASFHDPDSLRTSGFRESMAEKVSEKTQGASGAHRVSGGMSSESVFRTTDNLSENVSSAMIRGAGAKKGETLFSEHADADTKISEFASNVVRSGMNKHTKPVNIDSLNSLGTKKDSISRNSEREHIVAPISGNMPGGLAVNPTGSVNASKMNYANKESKIVDTTRVQKRSTPLAQTKISGTSTKNRRISSMLNDRLGSSSAVKKLLVNPYSKPAAARLAVE